MIKSLVFVSQAYLGYATPTALRDAADRARLALVIDVGETVNPALEPYLSRVYRLAGRTRWNLQPSFDVDELAAVVSEEMELAGADPSRTALFCQHEDNVMPAAQVRRRFGIAGHGPELVNLFRDKLAMKQALAPHLPHVLPRYQVLSVDRTLDDPAGYYRELVAELGTRVLIVKPTSAAGSLNVAVVKDPEDLARAGELIRADDHEFVYEVDEFVDGTMHQCDSFIRDGKVLFSGILELGCSNFDFVQGRPLSVYPVTDQALHRRLFDFNQEVITALGFRDGSTHHELFVRRAPDGTTSFTFLEIAARAPGGLGIPFHERNSGINLVDTNLALAFGDPVADDPPIRIRNNVVSALLPVRRGRIVSLNEPDVVSDYALDWRVNVGDLVDSRSLVDNAGILTLTNDDSTLLRRDFESLQSYVPVTCAP